MMKKSYFSKSGDANTSNEFKFIKAVKETSALVLSIFIIELFFAEKALAVCPICTIAVSAGVGLSRWLGIDDSITGLWLGGFSVSIIIWLESWLDKKNIKFKGRVYVSIAIIYALIIIPLYFLKIIGNPLNVLRACGLDKILFGIIVGSVAFWFGASWYFYLKEKNNGHAYFPFQKVVMPIAPLIILSIVFYFLTSSR